ncbi:hypothetical protein AB0I72_00505 [Nocardiopsis sp. NPDC049922]|uniref:hypothetical protein n=1 Tax=Nocardiopsis sp. NPDC049922 TaxID=3155157 RepID=UPI0033E130DB
MPQHKMITINGIRYRPEDVPEGYTPPARRTPRTLSTQQPTPPGPFDPSAAGVDAVLAYLETADHTEATRVLDAEADDKARSTILGKREEILAAKEGAGDGDSGGTAG